MKHRSKIIIATVLAACVAVGIYLVTSRKPESTAQSTVAVTQPKTVVKVKTNHPLTVKVYRIAIDNDQPVLRETESTVAPGKNPIEIALDRLIEQGDKHGMANPIPRGTRLLGWKVKGGLAQVNFTHEFRDNFTGGSDGEGLTIGAILRTLSQFPEIKRVQLLVEGQSIDTLGNIDLSKPLDVMGAGSDYGGGN